MNLPRLTLLCFVLLMAGAFATWAQDMSSTAPDAPPAGSTVITSDELRSDQTTRISVFSGNVLVVGTNFTMTCQEMTVNFTKDSKVDVITATGNVIINQPGRVTHSGQAQYFHDEDKFVLTDSPTIIDNKNQIAAPVITIFRTKQTMITSGGKMKLVLPNSGIGSATAPTTTPADKPATGAP